MTYIKRIIRRLGYSLNKFLYRFRYKEESNHFIYERDDEDSSR